MYKPTTGGRQDALLPQDEALLRSLKPRRLARSFVVATAVYSATFVGIDLWSSGSWMEALHPVNLLSGILTAGVTTAFNVWQNRRLLRRTAGETRDQLQRDWRFFTEEGWALRIAGVSAGLSAFFVTLAVVLTALTGPLAAANGFWPEIVKMLGFGFGVFFAVALLVRAAFTRAVESRVMDTGETSVQTQGIDR